MGTPLDADDTLAHLTKRLAQIEAQPDPLLDDIDSKSCFELGFAQAIHDLREFIEPETFQVQLVEATPKEEETVGQESA